VNAISRKEILAKIPPLDGIRPAESGGEGAGSMLPSEGEMLIEPH